MDANKIGQYIALCRKKLGLSQQALADELNISNKTISKWENGNGMPDIGVLPALAEKLGTTVDNILNGETCAASASISHYAGNETTEYLINKRIIRFKIESAISIAGGLISIVLWLLIRETESELYAQLVASSFALFSAVFFIAIYFVTKSEYRAYNRLTETKRDFNRLWRLYAYIGIFIWLFLPMQTLCHLLFADNIRQPFMALIGMALSVIVGSVFMLTGKRRARRKA